jgi:hypothetical protein
MRLLDYINKDMILEKVSKKDISSILTSDSVIVGAEFEFIADFLEEAEERYDNAVKDSYKALKVYDDYMEEVQDWEAEDEDDRGDPPSIPDTLIYYDDEHFGGDIGYGNYEDGDEIPPPLEPEYGGYLYDLYDIDDEDGWERCVDDFMKFSNTPFKGYKVGQYNTVSSLKYWAIEPDSSLGSYGIEIKSPPLPMKEFVKMCPEMFKWIDKVGGTNDDCGFHIHMSLKNIPNLSKSLDLVKLTMFTDEDYIFKFFPDRIDNTYTISMKKQLSREGITEDDWKDFIDVKQLSNKVYSQHYNSINWEGLEDDKQHIEFRYMGGSNYHKKWDKIKVIIAQYAYNLELACDPKSHMKEYARKISRMINKTEMLKYKSIIEWSEKLKKRNKFKEVESVIDMIYKKYNKEYRNLVGIYGKIRNGSDIEYYPSYEMKYIWDRLYNAYKLKGGKLDMSDFRYEIQGR